MSGAELCATHPRPSDFGIPLIACAPFGCLKWITLSSGKKMFTSSMPGMVLTCSGGVSASRQTVIGRTLSRFSVFCSRLSSVVVVLCTAFFLLQTRTRERRVHELSWEG